MQAVDIFIETSFKGPARKDGFYMYVLRYIKENGTEATIEDLKPIVDGTSNKAEASALLGALKRLKRPCKLLIHLPSTYCKSGIEVWSDGWIKKGFKNSKGEDIANREEWEEMLILLREHDISLEVGHHEFSSWMKKEIEKGK